MTMNWNYAKFIPEIILERAWHPSIVVLQCVNEIEEGLKDHGGLKILRIGLAPAYLEWDLPCIRFEGVGNEKK